MDLIYKKKVLFVGMPDMAVVVFKHLMEKGFNIVGIVPPSKSDITFGVMEKLAEAYNIPFFPYDNLKDANFLKSLKRLNADIGVVCSFNKKLPKDFLKITKDGFLNCHPSLLPNYRGGNPYSAVIMNNETETGVTIHFMDENFDTGDIVYQVKVEIDEDETMGTLFNKLNTVVSTAVSIVLAKYENSVLTKYSQPDGEFKLAPNFTQNSYQTYINWSKEAKMIDCKIRALNPFLLATTIFRHQPVKVMSCRYEVKQTDFPPGVVVDLSKGLGISCKDGVVYLKTLQYSTFVVTDSDDFIRRFSPKIGEKVG